MCAMSNDAMHLAQQGFNMYDVQRSNNFEIVINGVGGQDLTFATESFPLPKVSNAAIELAYMNSKVKVAGQFALEDFELVVKDLIDKDVEKIVNDWQKTVGNLETGKIGWAGDYKKSGTVYEYAPNGSFVRAWKLIGVWPNNVNYGDMDYNNSDKKTISMTLSVDKAFRDSSVVPTRESGTN